MKTRSGSFRAAALLLALTLLFVLAACGAPAVEPEPTPTPEPTPAPTPTPEPTPVVKSIVIRYEPEARELTDFGLHFGDTVRLDVLVFPANLPDPVTWSCDDPEALQIEVDPDNGNRCAVSLLQVFSSMKIYAELGDVKAEVVVYCLDDEAPEALPEGAEQVEICYAGEPLREFTAAVSDAPVGLTARITTEAEDAVVTWISENEDLVQITVDPDNGNRCQVAVVSEYTGPVMIRAEWNGLSASCRVYCRPENNDAN